MRLRTKKIREKFRNLVATYWQPTVFYGMLIVFFGLLLWFKLGSLVGGYSPAEVQAVKDSLSLQYILNHPLNAPFAILTHFAGLVYWGNDALLPARAVASFLGLVTLTTFYWLVRHWHGERSAILGTIVFGCSAWFLHTARLGTPDVLLFLPLAFIAGGAWVKHTGNRVLLLAGFGLAATLLYVPGMIWLLLAATLWQLKGILRLFKSHPILMAAGSVVLLALVAPLAWVIYKTPEMAKTLVGLPAQGWPQILDVAEKLAHVPYNLFIRGPLNPEHWLGRLPVLEAFSIVMFLFGLYLYVKHWRLLRSKMIGTALIIGTLAIGLGGAVSLSILIPFIYLLVAAGIGFMLEAWQKVFPRNTIAQGVAVCFISLAVIASSWYGLRHYFVAWPNNTDTKQVFVEK